MIAVVIFMKRPSGEWFQCSSISPKKKIPEAEPLRDQGKTDLIKMDVA